MLPAFFRVSSATGRDRTKPFLPEGNGLAAEGQPADPVRSCRRTQQRETVPPGSLQLPSRQVIQSRFGIEAAHRPKLAAADRRQI